MERLNGRMKSSYARKSPLVLQLAFTSLFLTVICASAGAASNGTIDTYVGGGNGDGDSAVDATIDPRGLALVATGGAPDFYIADGLNNRVRRVAGSTGLIETVAGDGTNAFGGDGGQAQNASLSFPIDVAVDGAGNVYIADTFNNRIRKVGTDRRISTFAGTGVATYSGEGIASQEAVNQPYGIAVGPDGNVYIADLGNNRIRRVSPPGCAPSNCVISTVVGNGAWGYGGDGGPATNAQLKNPADVVFDGSGNMYIADRGNNVIRRVAANGIISTVAGGGQYGPGGSVGDGGPGTQAVLYNPSQVDTDSNGNVYIADTRHHRIRMLQAGTFTISTVAGTGATGWTGDGGAPTNADLFNTWGVAATTPGTFWLSQSVEVAVSQQNRVRKVASNVIQTVIGGGLGSGGAAINAMVDPRGGEAVDTGGALPDLYFADGNNNVVRRVDGDTGIIDNIAGTGTAGYSGDGGSALNATLRTPFDVAVDAAGSVVYVADTFNNVVRKISGGVITTVAGTGQYGYSGEGTATQENLAAPRGVDVDRFGNLFIADSDSFRIRKVTTGGVISTVAGSALSGSAGDGGSATLAKLKTPSDVVVADDGTFYIADAQSNVIRRVNTAGIITTFAGNGNQSFSGDGGPSINAALKGPAYLALDAVGNLFIADSQNNRVRRVDAAGLIQTVAGNGQAGATGDGGSATAAAIGPTTGVAVGRSGDPLFVSAKDTFRVRIVSFGGAPQATATFTRTSIPPTPPPTNTPTHPSGTATRTSTPASSNVGISGKVTYYTNNQISVPGVDVNLTGPLNVTVRTSSNGNYSGAGLATGAWHVEPAKQGGFGNAVSSLDAARVLQAIAGMGTFTTLQRLACDVTGDGSLSALDAVRILQFSAGLINQLPIAQACGSDWLFYPSPDQMQNQSIIPPVLSGGNCQQGNIAINPLLVQATNQDFDAILIGDCTGNWSVSSGGSLRQLAPSATTVRAGKLRHAQQGKGVRLPIYVQSQAPFQSLDLKIGYDTSTLTLESVHPRGAAAEAMISVSAERPGVVAVSLASAQPIDAASGSVLFVEFRGADTAAVQLIGAQVDEQPARIVSAGNR